jgi:hypothetical protein
MPTPEKPDNLFDLHTHPEADKIMERITSGFLEVMVREIPGGSMERHQLANMLANTSLAILGNCSGEPPTLRLIHEVTEIFMKEALRVARAMRARAEAQEQKIELYTGEIVVGPDALMEALGLKKD